MRAVIVLLVALFSIVDASETFVVLVAGSSGYPNYRHQADVCHAFQIVQFNGVPRNNTIVMMFDDIANSTFNPFPGQLFNQPNGRDVYGGCTADYSGNDVTAANFLSVITGNATAMRGIGTERVLTSTSSDRVFIYFADHGGSQTIAFPSGPLLYAPTLISALHQMSAAQMFDQLVFYMEACQSGSMFSGLLPSNMHIYAVTAADPEQASFGTYCPPHDDIVNGTHIGVCLGDDFSVNWMQDADRRVHNELLAQQFEIVRNETTTSDVSQYGEIDWSQEEIVWFEGDGPVATKSTQKINSRYMILYLTFQQFIATNRRNHKDFHEAGRQLELEIETQLRLDDLFASLVHMVIDQPLTTKELESIMWSPPSSCVGSCCQESWHTFTTRCNWFDIESSLQYHRTIANLCEQTLSRNLSWAFDRICL